MSQEKYITGTGQVISVHTADKCAGRHCVIHNPSNHLMKDWPTHWRADRGIMERMCSCGVGHPDPDDLAYKKAVAERDGKKYYDTGIHGCCGCCIGKKAPG